MGRVSGGSRREAAPVCCQVTASKMRPLNRSTVGQRYNARRPVSQKESRGEALTMDDRKTWRPSRYGVLLVVLAFHVITIAFLIASSKTLRLLLPAAMFIEVASLPPAAAQRVRTD